MTAPLAAMNATTHQPIATVAAATAIGALADDATFATITITPPLNS
jgi:hypothetical protein